MRRWFSASMESPSRLSRSCPRQLKAHGRPLGPLNLQCLVPCVPGWMICWFSLASKNTKSFADPRVRWVVQPQKHLCVPAPAHRARNQAQGETPARKRRLPLLNAHGPTLVHSQSISTRRPRSHAIAICINSGVLLAEQMRRGCVRQAGTSSFVPLGGGRNVQLSAMRSSVRSSVYFGPL